MSAFKDFKDKRVGLIRVQSELVLYKKKKGDYWFIYCPFVRTLGYSKKSEQDALKDFSKSLQIFFKVHLEDGTLEKALLNFGWQKGNNNAYTNQPSDNYPSLYGQPIPYQIAARA